MDETNKTDPFFTWKDLLKRRLATSILGENELMRTQGLSLHQKPPLNVLVSKQPSAPVVFFFLYGNGLNLAATQSQCAEALRAVKAL